MAQPQVTLRQNSSSGDQDVIVIPSDHPARKFLMNIFREKFSEIGNSIREQERTGNEEQVDYDFLSAINQCQKQCEKAVAE